MTGPWDAWDDMPHLVDANMASQPPRNIPPPPGATVMNTGPPLPHQTPSGVSQYPWGTPLNQYTFPSQQDPYATWHLYSATPAYQQKSAPSPYIPHQPLNPQMPSHDRPPHSRRTQIMPTPQQMSHKRSISQPLDSKMPWHDQPPHSRRTKIMPTPQPMSHKKSNSVHKHFEWPTPGDLSPLNLQTAMPDTQLYAPRAPEMHTPSSTLSRTISSSSHIPPGMYHERPQQWRHDFKFKSGFASMFRTRPNTLRNADEFVDSAKLDLHPFLCYSRSRPLTIYDLRREPLTLLFRKLDRPPFADDMDHSVTHPPTKYMRIYHSRLPWYIDIRANGAPYISLGDFFQQLFAAFNGSVSKYDYYNNELDDEDRDVLRRTYLERCRNQDERMQGVKCVDFLRGKFEWLGLAPGKNGMWRLKSA